MCHSGLGTSPEVKHGDLTPVGGCTMIEKTQQLIPSLAMTEFVGHTFRNAGLAKLTCLTHDRGKLN